MPAIISFSTGLCAAIVGTVGAKGALDDSELRIYGGLMPAHANDSLGSATLICTVKAGADGITFDDATVPGALIKTAAETWAGTNVASGTKAFFRVCKSGDTGGASTTAVRLQGNIGLTDSALNVSSLASVASAPQTIAHFNIAVIGV